MKSQLPTTRPYLIRALHQWCSDHGFTPHLVIVVDQSVRVPRQHVRDNRIVLNISNDATGALCLGNDYVEFKTRFGGVPFDISVPVERVEAIYARENGEGLVFGVTDSLLEVETNQVVKDTEGVQAVDDGSAKAFPSPADATLASASMLPSAASAIPAKGKPVTLKRIK